MSRRVEKEYSTYTGSGWVAQSTRRFVYDDWNVVLVMDGDDNNAVTRKYTWGLDLSGLSGVGPASSRSGIHGAGGIGGLLAAVETGGDNQGSYWFLYDGNGNVGQVLDATDQQNIAVAARYEYDPYGNQLVSTGDYAAANPFRFSTKWFDAEDDYTTNDGLYYYGYRYYLPRLGRWGSRDPIGEKGGLSVYVFVVNNTINSIDYLGTITCTDAATYDDCCADCDEDDAIRRAGCKAIYDTCMAGANLSLTTCLGNCDGQCECSITCSSRCLGCYMVYGIQRSICLSANIGCLAGADLAQTACYGGCWLGSQVDFPDATVCPPGYY